MNLAEELVAAVPGTETFDPERHHRYLYDESACRTGGAPLAIAKPASTLDAEMLVRWARGRRVPLVPRGAGTGVSGGASATSGCVVVTFERMARIIGLDVKAMSAVVQPGVLNIDLKNAAREAGLWYPPDPSSFDSSSIGGNVATNAGGFCCVRYGVTGQYVLGLEVVLGDGTTIRTGGSTVKNVAGYDLTKLLVGSEGTLGLITEITMMLRPPPPPTRTLLATFASLEEAGDATARIMHVARPSLLELMDRTTLRAVEAMRPLGLDAEAAAMLIVEIDADAANELVGLREACARARASLVVVSEDEVEAEGLRAARRLAYPALQRRGRVLIDDVAVPLSRLPEMIRRIEDIAAREGVEIATVAHAGDGNLHPLIVFDGKDPDGERRAMRAFEAVMDDALALGGTVTGEHGVGTLKLGGLARQLGPESMALHRRVKWAFDPDSIMNPGKLLPFGD